MKIMVPLDGSELAESVLPCVEDLARRLSAEVHFVQVVSLDASLLVAASAGRSYTARLLALELRAEAEKATARPSSLAAEWTSRGIDARWEVVRGDPARCIIACASRCGADLIAMSTHGRSGVARLLLGSVAERVVRDAQLPVLLFGPTVASVSARSVASHAVA